MEEFGKIYKITNLINNEVYIGCTIKTIDYRFKEHLYRCFKTNINTKLYNSIRKYGVENFIIEKIIECELSIIYDAEKEYILYYDSFINGLNSTFGGEGCLGYKHSPEILKKMSKIQNEQNNRRGKTYKEIYGDENFENEQLKRQNSVKIFWNNIDVQKKIERVNKIKNSNRKNSKYGIDLIRKVKDKINIGLSNKDINLLFPEISAIYISSIRKGRTWRDINE